MFGKSLDMRFTEFAAAIDPPTKGHSEQEIAAFEEAIGVRLPDDYREFLTFSDDGCLAVDVEFKPISSELNGTVVVWHVFGLRGSPDPEDGLYWYLEDAGELTSNDLLRVFSDGSGCHICLGVKGERRGQVFFQELGDVYWICESFQRFITDLKPR